MTVCRFNKNGNYCMSGGKDRKIRLWNPHRSLKIAEYEGPHGYEILDLAISHDNSLFASVGGDKTAFLWDVKEASVVRRFQGHEGRINTCAFNKDSSVLVTGSYDKTVRLYDCRSHARMAIQVLDEFSDSVTSVRTSSSDIVAVSVDGKIRRYDMRMGQLYVDHICQPITCIALSHDFDAAGPSSSPTTSSSKCYLASCLDNTIRLMDCSTGELLNEYKGHMNENYKVEATLTSDDAYVVSGSEDGIIYIWDVVDARVVHKLNGHTRMVTGVSWHPQELCALSCSADGSIKLWK